jgi:hypothetical protein
MPARTDQQQTGAHSGGAVRRQLLRGLSTRQPGHFSALAGRMAVLFWPNIAESLPHPAALRGSISAKNPIGWCSWALPPGETPVYTKGQAKA